MDISNENGDADHESSQPPSQQPNGLQNEDPSGSQVEGHPDTPADGHPVSQPNSQPATQSNDTPNAQANGHPGTQTPPSGQGNSTEEEPIDPKELLEPFGWDDLEERFAQKMEECQRQEAEIEQEFREWCQVFQAWASTTREHEEERLHKRLKTRMAWVQNSESTFEEKRQHYIKVVQAFERMLALMERIIGKPKKEESNAVIGGRAKDEASNHFNDVNIDHDDGKVQEELMLAEEEKAMDDEHEWEELIIAEEERGIGFHRARCVVS